MEFRAVVEMQRLRHAVHRPRQVQSVPGEPLRLRQHALRDRDGDAGGRRCVERQRETRNRPREDVKEQGQPGPPKDGARRIVDELDVHLGVIDLHDGKRVTRPQARANRDKALPRRLGSLSRLHDLSERARRHARLDRLARRRFQAGRTAILAEISRQFRHGRPLAAPEDVVDGLFDSSLDGEGQQAGAVLRAGFGHHKRACHRLLAKLPDQPVDLR